MRLFSALYNKVLDWSGHRHAPMYLAGVSFAESSMFPVPPDVMLVSMGLVKPHKAWEYALIATIASVLGGMLGYFIGASLLHFIMPYLEYMGYLDSYKMVQHWFELWGVWIVFVAGFSPIPYKLFTIAAGALHMLFWPFVLASLLGRGCRFFLVSLAMFFFGDKIRDSLKHYIDILGWLVVALLGIIYLIVKISSY